MSNTPRLRQFFAPARLMDLALYFASAFVQDPGRVRAWKTQFEKDLKRAGIAFVPLQGKWQGDYNIDPDLEEQFVANKLMKLGWQRISAKNFVFQKDFPQGGTFVIQIKRWKANRGRIKTFLEGYDDATRQRDAEWETKQSDRYQDNYNLLGVKGNPNSGTKASPEAKKKYGYERELLKNTDLDKPLNQPAYNNVKHTHDEDILAILELTQYGEQPMPSKEDDKMWREAKLSKDTINNPHRRNPDYLE